MRSSSVKAATTACMPRLIRGGCRASTARPAASVSLLERIRDVVLRLIMLSAVSKASVKRTDGDGGSSSTSPRAGRRRERAAPATPPVSCRRDDSIRNEAVEDCIEFLKRSSAEGDAAKLSSVTTAETVSVARDLATKSSGSSPSTAIVTTDAVTAHGEPAQPRSNGQQHLAASVAASSVTSGDVEAGRHRSASPATANAFAPRLRLV